MRAASSRAASSSASGGHARARVRRRARAEVRRRTSRTSSAASSSDRGPETTPRDLRRERAGPSTPKPVYETSFVDRAFLRAFASIMERELTPGRNAREDDGDDFAGVRDACLRLVRESSGARETRAKGLMIIRNCAPPGFAGAFGGFLRLFPKWFAARHAAAVTPMLLPWLVGEAEVNDAPEDVALDVSDDVSTSVFAAMIGAPKVRAGYKQGVLLKRCRVLEETGCAAVCANVCKHPTQKFFTEEIGLPVTLTPNYETFECQFTYGATPPSVEADPAFASPCFRQCGVSETLRDAECGNALESDESPCASSN